MTNFPTLTPAQAKLQIKNAPQTDHCLAVDCLVVDGFMYYLDGPAMATDESVMFPVAVRLDDDASFFPSGEVDEPITAETKWVVDC